MGEWFDRAVKYRWNIKELLGVNISPNSTPIQAAQQILGVLGLKLDYIDRAQVDGRRVRRYQGADVGVDGRLEVLQRWLERDTRAAEMAYRPAPLIIDLLRGWISLPLAPQKLDPPSPSLKWRFA